MWIEQVVENGFCSGCGTCQALCPASAISIVKDSSKGVYIPRIKSEKCTDCGICVMVCPSVGSGIGKLNFDKEINFEELNLDIFGKKPDDNLLGNFINSYTGFASDQEIRYNSASGGLVTASLIFALEEKMIQGALVTMMNGQSPLKPKSFIARSKKEILLASKSKYCPVPANVALKEIFQSDMDERFAVVGLPCHIQGIRKAEKISEKLKEKIILHLGLFCNHTVSFLGTEFLLNKLGIEEEEVKELNYRGEGWPGGMTVKLKNGGKKVISLNLYWGGLFGLYYFTPTKCLLCNDAICELSDISFGDAWLPEFSDDKIGRSIVLSRTKAGEEFLKNVSLANKIELSNADRKKIISSVGGILDFKKEKIYARAQLLSRGDSFPNLNKRLLFSLFPLVNKYVSESKILRRFLKLIPLKVLRMPWKMHRYIAKRLR